MAGARITGILSRTDNGHQVQLLTPPQKRENHRQKLKKVWRVWREDEAGWDGGAVTKEWPPALGADEGWRMSSTLGRRDSGSRCPHLSLAPRRWRSWTSRLLWVLAPGETERPSVWHRLQLEGMCGEGFEREAVSGGRCTRVRVAPGALCFFFVIHAKFGACSC